MIIMEDTYDCCNNLVVLVGILNFLVNIVIIFKNCCCLSLGGVTAALKSCTKSLTLTHHIQRTTNRRVHMVQGRTGNYSEAGCVKSN